jgi:hypothetical protein
MLQENRTTVPSLVRLFFNKFNLKMEAIKFVKLIRERVIESNHAGYQNMLTNTNADDATDPTWKRNTVLI